MATTHGLTSSQRTAYNEDLRLMRIEYPYLYEFCIRYSKDRSSRRLGKKRISYLYRIIKTHAWINVCTKHVHLIKTPDIFWDLIDSAHKLFDEDRDYAIDTVIYLYLFLLREKHLPPAWESIHSPVHVIYSEWFQRYLHREYKGRDCLFFLRHGQMMYHSQFYVLDYHNQELRDMFVDSILQWKYAWNKRTPSRLGVLLEAEEWFEGTTDGVRSWEDFNAQMLDVAKRHICLRHEGEWRLVCLKFLFYFYSQLILQHPDYDFFKGSLVYCPEMVLDNRTPKHLADGFEFAFFGQQNPFLQGRGMLFVIKDAHLQNSSNRKTEIKQYDFSKITNHNYWNAIANYCLHGNKEIIAARSFLIWLEKHKTETRENPLCLTADDMDAYRIYISKKMANSGSRNAYVRCVTHFINWLQDSSFLQVNQDALNDFSYFLSNQEVNPQPLTKQDIQKLRDTLIILGQNTPRYLLVELILRILLLSDVRVGALVSILLEDIEFLDDGSSKCHILSKTSNPDRQTFTFTQECTDLLREAITLTEDIRGRCPRYSVKEHLFLYERVHGRSAFPFNSMNIQRFNLDLKAAAKKAGISHVSSGRLRDTFMTATNLYMIENNVPDYKKPVLTNHKDKRSILNYAIFNIGDILERSPRYTVGRI